jgi:hypothetical protein
MEVPEDNLFSRLALHPSHPSLSLVPHRDTAPQARGAGIISRPPPCTAAAGSWEVFFGLSRPVHQSGGAVRDGWPPPTPLGDMRHPLASWDLAPDDSGDSTANSPAAEATEFRHASPPVRMTGPPPGQST